MVDFESLLAQARPALQRYVFFRIDPRSDAEDVVQEICLAAYEKFHQLRSPDSFKPWLISIARNKCSEFFRRRAGRPEILSDSFDERLRIAGRPTPLTASVHETLDMLPEMDRRMLYMYFWLDLTQAEMAKSLGIPLGTVKSRLHSARENFRDRYPYLPIPKKGETAMKKMPLIMPEYKITPSFEAPFPVKWEEIMGWMCVPREGEKVSWGMYDMPARKLSLSYDMEVVGRAMVHSIEGVELTAIERDPAGKAVSDWTFIAQLTDTHCRYLATTHVFDGVKKYITFLDGDEFMPNWGFGPDNCGNEILIAPKGDITRQGDIVTCADKDFLLDVVGRCAVEINGKSYDTVCVMDVETYDSGRLSEQYLDRDGRTVLCRMFNRDDWRFDRYGKKWSEMLPENQRLTVNGVTYVHWYDCITDRVI